MAKSLLKSGKVTAKPVQLKASARKKLIGKRMPNRFEAERRLIGSTFDAAAFDASAERVAAATAEEWTKKP